MSPNNNRLRHERERRGWSQSKLAGLVGTNPATIGRWERGISLPYPIHREKLCELFGKDARALGLIEEAGQEWSTVAVPVQMSPVQSPGHGFIFDPAIPMPAAETNALVGRDALLEQLKQQLYAGGTLAVSALSGLPGVGKTALALTLAHDAEVQQYFQHGILWVGPGIQPDVQELLGRWGVLVGLPASEMGTIKNYDEWARTLRALIGMRRMLLIIDDVWDVDEALMFLVGGPNCAYMGSICWIAPIRIGLDGQVSACSCL
jgi:DNA-binding XRE family transcriptional regulator